MRHVVESRIQLQLSGTRFFRFGFFGPRLDEEFVSSKLSHAQDDDADDQNYGEGGYSDQESRWVLPINESGGYNRGDNSVHRNPTTSTRGSKNASWN